MNANPPTEWHGCYNDSWQGIIVDEAFAHPAKFARGLIRRIYQHMLDSGYIARGDSVVDPFGGVGLGGLDAMTFGLHYVGCELEPRFVELGNRNIDKWQHDLRMLNGTLGTARLVQGDSRRLLEVVGGGMGAAVSSPPYIDAIDSTKHGLDLSKSPTAHDRTRHKNVSLDGLGANYGSTPGQLGSMPSGDYAAVVSSPPYVNALSAKDDGIDWSKGQGGRDFSIEPGQAIRLHMGKEYGSAEGQLGSMPPGSFDSAVSSPPYSDMIDGQGEGPGARHDPIYHNGDNAYKPSSANGYGDTPGNIGHMAGDGFEAAVADAVVSSPPYEASHMDISSNSLIGTSVNKGSYGRASYGDSSGQLAETSGDTFWTAARVIVEQTYAVLKPGGYAAWVTKRFIRKGQIVEFSEQWAQLCEAVGFVRVEWVRAMLTEEHGHQLDIFGGATARRKERKSFFRRLAEKKGSPRIDHEDVIIMRKPQ